MQRILKTKRPKRPELFLLGIDLQQIDKADRMIIWYMIVAACVVYAKYWKQTRISSTTEWLNKLLFYAEMDKLTRKLREQNEVEYKEDWQKLEKYLTKRWGTKGVSWNLDHY